MRISRRAFVTTTALGVAGCAGARTGASSDKQVVLPRLAEKVEAVKPPGHEITAETLAEAEKLVAVAYTPAERELMLKDIGLQVERAAALRKDFLPNSLAPATVFVPGPLPPPPGRAGVRPPRGARAALPAKDEDIAYAPLASLADWLRTRKITSERLTELYLERLQRIGAKLECVITLTGELALSQARAADAEIARGRYRGPLHGVPWGAKDLLDTRGIPTTWGIAQHRDRRPDADAVVVERLARAGAVLVAKLSLGELAMGDVWFAGVTRNPWNGEEGSSGSSAGSAAAVAAGLVAFAIGSETLGSIVSPSMRCGVTGLRPTFGRVARTGAMALCWSLDKLGPLTRTVLDSILVLDAINGADSGDPSSVSAPLAFDASASLAGKRVGYMAEWFADETATDVDRRALDAVRKIGLEPVEIRVPALEAGVLLTILLAECASAFEELTLTGRDDELRQQTVNAWPNAFRESRLLSAVDLVHAQRVRRRLMGEMAQLFEKVDLLVGPSFAGGLLGITNLTGHPSLTLRAGFVEEPTRGFGVEDVTAPPGAPKASVPHGVTLWGRLYHEGTLCRAGMALEAELDVWHRRPPIG